tara:strand:+ start:188466 stop:189836 length:1371 start_codon:yes stop_codon:yes gene_type:complete
MALVKIHFLGASGTVTGSKFYVETPESTLLIDCGLFQGLKELRTANRQPFPIPVSEVDIVLLTHGHLDHTGYLPKLVAEGYQGPIVGSGPTLAIAKIILRDSAKIQEEEAEHANENGYGHHSPALPLYTLEDAERAISLFEERELDQWVSLSVNIRYRFRYNGHILGATFIELEIFGKIMVFSGDIGRAEDVLLSPPQRPQWADYLFVEGTYGNRDHPHEDVESVISTLVHRTIKERGTLIIPSFAVERLQTLMYILWTLYRKNRIPNIPIFVDSPMGAKVLSVFSEYPEWHALPLSELEAMGDHINIVSSYKDTWKTLDDPRPKIVIAGSGMVTGGRVLTYLKQLLDQKNTTVLLVGYQAEGTRGRQLLEGAHEIKFFGKYHSVKARIEHLESLSAHADQKEILHWLGAIRNIPEMVFPIHGEPLALDALRVKIGHTFGWKVYVPRLYEILEILV